MSKTGNHQLKHLPRIFCTSFHTSSPLPANSGPFCWSSKHPSPSRNRQSPTSHRIRWCWPRTSGSCLHWPQSHWRFRRSNPPASTTGRTRWHQSSRFHWIPSEIPKPSWGFKYFTPWSSMIYITLVDQFFTLWEITLLNLAEVAVSPLSLQRLKFQPPTLAKAWLDFWWVNEVMWIMTTIINIYFSKSIHFPRVQKYRLIPDIFTCWTVMVHVWSMIICSYHTISIHIQAFGDQHPSVGSIRSWALILGFLLFIPLVKAS